MKKLFTILIIALVASTSWVNADDRTPEQIVDQTSTEILKIINENNTSARSKHD